MTEQRVTKTITAEILTIGKRQSGNGYRITIPASAMGSSSKYAFTLSGRDEEDVAGLVVGKIYQLTVARGGLKKNKSMGQDQEA